MEERAGAALPFLAVVAALMVAAVDAADLRLGVMTAHQTFPYSTVGYETALTEIRANASVLQGHTLTAVRKSSGCSATTATSASLGHLQEYWTEPVPKSFILAGILGTSCSGAMAGVSTILGYAGLAALGTTVSSPQFFAPGAGYDHILSINHSDRLIGTVMASLCDLFKWKRVHVIQQDMPISQMTMDQFEVSHLANGGTMIGKSTIITGGKSWPTNDATTQNLLSQSISQFTREAYANNAKVFALLLYQAALRRTMCTAYKAGLTGPGYVYVMVGWISQYWWQASKTNCPSVLSGTNTDPDTCEQVECTDLELLQASMGMIFVDANDNPTPNVTTIGGRTPTELKAQFEATWSLTTDPKTLSTWTVKEAATSYDAMWTWALTLDKVLKDHGGDPTSITQSNVMAAMETVNFEGMTGTVGFNMSLAGMRNPGFFTVGQLRPHETTSNMRPGEDVLISVQEAAFQISRLGSFLALWSPNLGRGSYSWSTRRMAVDDPVAPALPDFYFGLGVDSLTGEKRIPSDGGVIARSVNVKMANDPNFGFRPPWDQAATRLEHKYKFAQCGVGNLRCGLVPSVLSRVSFAGSEPLGKYYDFEYELTHVGVPYQPADNTTSTTSASTSNTALPNRISWTHSTALRSAPDLCNELLQMTVAQSVYDLRAVVVPVEPAVTPGFHPCLSPEIEMVELYKPHLAILIRDEVFSYNMMGSALIAMGHFSTLKAISIFFLLMILSGILIWFCERRRDGLFELRKRHSFLNGLEDLATAYYWAITTGTSTGYGDLCPVTPLGRIWGGMWMVIGIIGFALVAAVLTNEILVITVDHTIYALSDVSASSRVAAVTDVFYGVQNVLLTQTPLSKVEHCELADCVQQLYDLKLDAVVGSYTSLLSAKARFERDNPSGSMLVTGSLFEDDRTWRYYLAYKREHFDTDETRDFQTKLRDGVGMVSTAQISIEAANNPLNERGTRTPAPPEESPEPFVLPLVGILAFHFLAWAAAKCIAQRAANRKAPAGGSSSDDDQEQHHNYHHDRQLTHAQELHEKRNSQPKVSLTDIVPVADDGKAEDDFHFDNPISSPNKSSVELRRAKK